MGTTSTIKQFYTTKAWRNCRASFIAEKQGLCERCLANGMYVVGEQVHHKIRLTPLNIKNPEIALNSKNLELLCEECHEREHGKLQQRVDEYGHVEL